MKVERCSPIVLCAHPHPCGGRQIPIRGGGGIISISPAPTPNGECLPDGFSIPDVVPLQQHQRESMEGRVRCTKLMHKSNHSRLWIPR
jgi:hypothetical protein